MNENIRETFLEYWEEIGRVLIRHPELEKPIEDFIMSGELICDGSMHLAALETILLVAKWMTYVLGIPTTFKYDKDAFERAEKKDMDFIRGLPDPDQQDTKEGDKGRDLINDLFKRVDGYDGDKDILEKGNDDD